MRKRGRRLVSVVERSTCPSIRPVAASAGTLRTRSLTAALGSAAKGKHRNAERTRRPISRWSRVDFGRSTLMEIAFFGPVLTEVRAVRPLGNIQYTGIDRLPRGGSARLRSCLAGMVAPARVRLDGQRDWK